MLTRNNYWILRSEPPKQWTNNLLSYRITMLLFWIWWWVWLMLVGMMIVWIRHDQSWLSTLIPGINYYVRTKIAGRSTGLSLITTCINLWLMISLCYQRYLTTNLWINSSALDIIRQYLITLPSVLQNNIIIVLWILLLQIRVNRWVAHRQGRWLLSGIELTLFAPVFWLILALTTKKTSDESEEMW